MDIYWVVGEATNVGKTTVACALIRALENREQQSIGFKPYVGGRFRDLIDFAYAQFPKIPNTVFGSDGFELCSASSLTCDSDVDLVTPWQLIFNSKSDKDNMFIRTGSQELGNVQYYRTPLFDKLLTRRDIHKIVEDLKWPVENTDLVDLSVISRRTIDQEIPDLAFTHLLRRNPKAVVVEAAGPFLPVWQGCPRVNHIVLVGNNEITLIANINVSVKYAGKRPFYTKELIANIKKMPVSDYTMLSMPQFYTEKSQRQAMLALELEGMLAEANL